MKDFNTQCFLEAAKELVRADETIRALQLLDNLPAYYRDNVPTEVFVLKNEILKKICTPDEYAVNEFDEWMDLKDLHGMRNTLRARIILKEVQNFNQAGLTPHVVDYGPGEFWLPLLLKQEDCQFTYDPIILNQKAYDKAKIHFVDNLMPKSVKQPKIFVATEIIEHLWEESEIRAQMLKRCNFADIVHLSTPKYTFDDDCMDWTTKGQLGHLRAYTPREFSQVIQDIFSDYNQIFYNPSDNKRQILHARLSFKYTEFPEVKMEDIMAFKDMAAAQ